MKAITCRLSMGCWIVRATALDNELSLCHQSATKSSCCYKVFLKLEQPTERCRNREAIRGWFLHQRGTSLFFLLAASYMLHHYSMRFLPRRHMGGARQNTALTTFPPWLKERNFVKPNVKNISIAVMLPPIDRKLIKGFRNMQIISDKFFMNTSQRNLDEEASTREMKVVIKQKIESSDWETTLEKILSNERFAWQCISIFQTV